MISKIFPLLLALAILSMWVMPESFLGKIPRALETKEFIQKNLSRTFHTIVHVIRVVLHNLQRAFFATKEVLITTYQRIAREVQYKLAALRDLLNALDRLRSREESSMRQVNPRRWVVS